MMVELSKTALSRADFVQGYWKGAHLSEANLERALLWGANLDSAVLIGANLEGALLMNASLKGAMLDSANLEDALLHGANLEHATLGEVPGAGRANLSGAFYDRATQWPDGFDPDAHGAVLGNDLYGPSRA
jgi:uncharacterized protein YjbI with pentapeptide repeats